MKIHLLAQSNFMCKMIVVMTKLKRSASAIAANHTMAIINRLQEEKATMRMETLQHQRMMEEQSEDDNEALLLLNELMIKSEKEEQELEEEIGIYRKKVQEYEVTERTVRSRRDVSIRSRNSSPSAALLKIVMDCPLI